MIKVKGHSSFCKKENGAVVNTDYSAFLRAKEKKKQKQKISEMESRLDKMESMLELLVDKLIKEK